MDMKLTSFYLDPERRKALKLAAAEEELRGMGDAIRHAVDLWLEQRERARKGKRPQDKNS